MRNYALILLLLACRMPAPAQTCTGSLGDNIFTAGDFGSGAANILLSDPRIALDYRYVPNGPPNDGEYVITNNTGVWPNRFSTWLMIGDNSPDPNGYMMVVNAGVQPGLFYNQEVNNLCPNTLYEFSVDVINLIRRNITGHIAPNISFLIDGVERFTTGQISQTERWETFGFTFTTGANQTSVRLSLRNNAPGGIGNDLALDNIRFRPCGDKAFILPVEAANICEDGAPVALQAVINGNLFATPAYQWQRSPDGVHNWIDIPGANSTTYLHAVLAAGSYFYRFVLANSPGNLLNEKCRLFSNAKEVRVIPKYYSLTDTICAGSAYIIGDSAFTSAGRYEVGLINSIGCDSIIRLNLVVSPKSDIQAVFEMEPVTCSDAAQGQIRILEVNRGTPPYRYAIDGKPPGNAVLFTPLRSNATYRFTITDRYSCILDTSIQLILPELPRVDLGPDLQVSLGEEVALRAITNFEAVRYDWSSSAGGLPDCPSAGCAELRWSPAKDQTIRLTAIDNTGCAVSDSLRIQVIPNYRIYIPTAFSPNGDGVNDYFTLFGPEPRIKQLLHLRIYDRWGGLVFSTRNIPPGDEILGWDGRSRGKPAPDGVYLYQLAVEFLDGKVAEFSGEVMMVR